MNFFKFRKLSKNISKFRSQAEETLIIVTSDHSHTLTINGIASRGNDILGIAQNSVIDGVPYTTLTYGSGGPMGFQVSSSDYNNGIYQSSNLILHRLSGCISDAGF